MRTDLVLDRRRREREQRLGLARDFVRDLTLPGVSAVVVFGSVARGDFNLWSDVDVLVVAEGLAHGLLARAAQLGAPPPGVQVIAWTPREWRRQLQRRNPIAIESRDHGVWLRGAPDLIP